MRTFASKNQAAVRGLKTFLFLAACAAAAVPAAEKVEGWLNWRGPHQDGVSTETNLPDTWAPGGENSLWTADIPGQCAPVIANGRVYTMGFKGDGADMQEGLFCLDAANGKTLWDSCFNDFLSDTIYLRYASSSPVVDPESGNIYTLGSQGFVTAYSPEGKILWQHSMMEQFGFMTFPNGRTGRPAIDGPLLILSAITANWGASGPAANRFYAFDKTSGELIYATNTPNRPRDNSSTTPVFDWSGNKRVFYADGGDGYVYCYNARTGEMLWNFHACRKGMSGTALLYKGNLIFQHGSENLDGAVIGRMVSLKLPTGDLKPGPDGAIPELKKEDEAWRCDVSSNFSSPVLVGNRIYLTDDTARLCAIDADTGKLLWRIPLSVEVVFSTPLYADGKLYVPVLDGTFYIIKPGETAETTKILSKVRLEGKLCSGPAVCDGRVYIQTGLQPDGKLYCLGKKDANQKAPAWPALEKREPGPLARYVATPADILIHPGEMQKLNLIPADKDGNYLPAKGDEAQRAAWARFIPPTAKVKSEINGNVEAGVLKAEAKPIPSAGALKADLDGKIGVTRGRIMPGLPLKVDFSNAVLSPTPDDPAVKFAFPPLPWTGARFRWEIREKDDRKCFYKTVENKLFQRAMTFIGTPEMKDYTIQADILSDGVVRKIGGKDKVIKISEVGVICNRYIVKLMGGMQTLEIDSNYERLTATAPFEWKPNVWYTIKARVDIDAATGAGVVRGKAWKRGDPEPEKWTLEVPHKTAHKNGSPGLFGFSPQDVPVYVDNISVIGNK